MRQWLPITKRPCGALPIFCHGKLHASSLGKVTQDEAENKVNLYLLMRLKQNLLQLPSGIVIVTFISFDGNPPHATSERIVPKSTALQKFRPSLGTFYRRPRRHGPTAGPGDPKPLEFGGP